MPPLRCFSCGVPPPPQADWKVIPESRTALRTDAKILFTLPVARIVVATNPTNGSHRAKNQTEELAIFCATWGAVVSTVIVAPGVDGATEQVGANDGVGATEQV